MEVFDLPWEHISGYAAISDKICRPQKPLIRVDYPVYIPQRIRHSETADTFVSLKFKPGHYKKCFVDPKVDPHEQYADKSILKPEYDIFLPTKL